MKPITAKHWLPSDRTDFDDGGDLRSRIRDRLLHEPLEPVVMDPEKPDPVKVMSVSWFHADCHGIMTREIFEADIAAAIGEFANMVNQDYGDQFRPVRIYKEAAPAWGVAFFDWRGFAYPFDIRAVVQFGSWDFTLEDGCQRTFAGFQFHLATLVTPRPDDVDIYVGQDIGAIFDEKPDTSENTVINGSVARPSGSMPRI